MNRPFRQSFSPGLFGILILKDVLIGSQFGTPSSQNTSSFPITGFGQTPDQSNTAFGGIGNSSFSATFNPSSGSVGSYGVAFQKVEESDNFQRSRTRTFLMSISVMTQFHNQPLDLTRAIDYRNGHKRRSGNVQINLKDSTTQIQNTNTFGSSTPQNSSTVFHQSTQFAFSPRTGPVLGSQSPVFGQQRPLWGHQGASFGQQNSGFGQLSSSGGGLFSIKSPGSIFGASFPVESSASSTGNLFSNQVSTSAGGLVTPISLFPGQQSSTTGLASPEPKTLISDRNWSPAAGIISPDLHQFEDLKEQGIFMERFDYIKGQGTKSIPITYPIKFVLEDDSKPETRNLSNSKKDNTDWSMTPKKVFFGSRSDEKLEQWIQQVKKCENKEISGPSENTVIRERVVEALVGSEQNGGLLTGVNGFSKTELLLLLPVVTQSDYYVLPSAQGLLRLMQSTGKDAVKRVYGVEIGRHDFGKVVFAQAVDLERLDVVKSVEFRRGMILIPEDSPLKGLECSVILYKAFFGVSNQADFTDETQFAIARKRALKLCQNRGYFFQSFDRNGTWVFKIK